MILENCLSCLLFKNEDGLKQIDYSNISEHDFTDLPQFSETLEMLIMTSAHMNYLPTPVFQCQNLRHLAVDNNYVKTLPDAIGTLRHLQYLNLNHNLLSTVPDNVKNCKNLTYLDLSCNNLKRLPEAVTGLISLQELFLNETNLEFLPASFGRLINLKILELRLNCLVALPKSISRLKNLERLDIGGNEFTELPDFFGELQQLRELWVDFNEIRYITPNIGRLHHLKHFEANGNALVKLPEEINQWRNIELISICINKLSQLQIFNFVMKSLVTLKCESCELSEIPKSISFLENLEELDISNNKIHSLPKSIGFLRKLRYVFADYNNLITLPIEICSCVNLNILSLSHNQIKEIPENIGHLKNLKVLNVVNNFISTFPTSVLNLVNLKSLWISDNQSKPLVQFQYLDTISKSKLTCFMLPQSNINNEYLKKISTTLNEKSDSSITSYHQQKYFQSHSKVLINNMKKISFAEKEGSDLFFELYDNKQQNVNLSDLTEEQSESCLMRSPTPYPKDLVVPLKCQRTSSFINLKKRGIETYEKSIIENDTIETVINSTVCFNNRCIQESLQTNYLLKSSKEFERNIETKAKEQFEIINFPFQQKSLESQKQKIFIDNGYFNENELNQLNHQQKFQDTYRASTNVVQENIVLTENNDSLSYRNNSLSYTPATSIYNMTNYLDNFDIENNEINGNITCNNKMRAKNNNLTNNIEIGIGKKNKTPWIFGIHKNPTVMQFVIEFETDIGFDVMEMPQKNGIYISSIVPNTCASKLLNLYDKVLEIDGYDFSMININDAKKIISNGSSVMNIMISRKD